jgi:tetratricopeptide (TPR) repeat protein
MDYKTIIIILLSASFAAYFIPTPLEVQTRFKSGQDFYAGKDYRRAIEQYEWIISAESKFLEADSVRVNLFGNEMNVAVRTAAYYQKGNALRNLGKKEESIANYRIVEKRTDSPQLSALAQYQIYEMFYADKEYAKAIEEARYLIHRYPFDERVPKAWYDIGWAFRELGMIDSSNVAFLSVMTQYPKSEFDPRARFQYAQNLFEQAKWDSAIGAFNNLIEAYRPESFAATEWENVELKAVRDRRLFEAQAGRDVDASTLELVAKAQVRIGDAYRQKGEYERAMQSYRKVISTFTLMPTLVEATYIKMAEYTSQAKGFDEGILIYRRAIDENFANKPLQAKLQYKIARTYQDEKLYEKAATEYLFYTEAYAQQAEQIKFPVEQSYFLAVSNFYNARNYRNTLAYADTILTLFPQTEFYPKVVMYKGLAASGLGRFAEARTHFQKVIESSPSSNEAILARIQIGKSHFDERNYTEAVSNFEALLSGDPSKSDTSEVHYLLGLSYYGLNEHEKSIRHLSSVDPGSSYFPYTFARVTRAYAAQQKYSEAEEYLNKAFETAKRDSIDYTPFVRLARSELYTAQQKFDAAVQEFTVIIDDSAQTENTRVQALYGRGLIFFELGNFREAAADLQRCINSGVFQQVFTPLVPQAKEKLAFSYINLNRKQEGMKLLNELLASASSDREKSRYLALLAEFHYRAGEHAKAIEVGQQVLALSERDEMSVIRTYVTMSNSYGNLQQHDKAIATLKEAGENYPTNAYLEEVFFQLGMIYYNGGDYRSSAEAFRGHLQRFPTSRFKEDALYFHAYSLYHMGKADEAIKECRAFLQSYPSSKHAPDAQLQIAEAYFNTNRFEEAIREYQALYRRFPQSELAPQAMYNEAWSYYQQQQNDKMLRTFAELIQRFPKSKLAADAQFTIGDYFYNQKSYDSALVAYQAFLEKFPDDARVAEAQTLIKDLNQVEAFREYEAAMAFFDAKNWKVAIEELTKVMNKYPDTEIMYGCKANIASAYEQLGERKKALALFEEIIAEGKDKEAARTAVFFAELHKRWIEAGK